MTDETRGSYAKWLFPLIAMGLTLVVAVGLSELALWTLAPIPYDEWMVYENEGHIHYRAVPNQSFKNRFGSEIRINKDGFRGPDYSYEKPAGTLRIAVVGESSAFCYNSSDEKSWPGALQLKLTKRLGVPVEVVNLSLPGFDIFNSKVNYMAYGRAYHPDALIVYHTWNDMKYFRDLENVPYRARGPIDNKPLWQRVARETQIGRRARNFMFTMTGRTLENKYKADEGTGANTDRPIDPKAYDWERRNFLDIVTLAEGDGVLPILVSQATLVTPEAIAKPEIKTALMSTPDNVGITLSLLAEAWRDVTTLIEEVARERNVIFVDGYRAVPSDLTHLEDHVHLWDAGSEVLAEEIARVLAADPRFLGLADRVTNASSVSQR